MSHYELRRRELLGERKRRPKTGCRWAAEAYRCLVEAKDRQRKAEVAGRRLARVLGVS